MDSGCVDHICGKTDVPGYDIEQLAGSRRGQEYTVGTGGKVSNHGEGTVCTKVELDGDECNAINSVFQVADITRPLMSVSRICDANMTATFDREKAVIRDAKGKVVCIFRRRGGLYVCRMNIKTGPCTRPGR